MKIGLCSLTIGEEYKRITEKGRITKVKYCEKNNYDFIEDETIHDSKRPFSWSKIPLIKKYLPNYDYLVWIDGDTMIFNQDKTLESFIDKYMVNKNKEFLVATDAGNEMNLGVFFIKNTEYMLSLLDKIYDQTEFINHHLWEQASFKRLYNTLPELKEKCVVLPKSDRREFNGDMYVFQQGDFLIHFLGIHKHEWMKKVMEDHYPFHKSTEHLRCFEGRMEWFNRRYPKSKKV